jgi:hypothetical protein
MTGGGLTDAGGVLDGGGATDAGGVLDGGGLTDAGGVVGGGGATTGVTGKVSLGCPAGVIATVVPLRSAMDSTNVFVPVPQAGRVGVCAVKPPRASVVTVSETRPQLTPVESSRVAVTEYPVRGTRPEAVTRSDTGVPKILGPVPLMTAVVTRGGATTTEPRPAGAGLTCVAEATANR